MTSLSEILEGWSGYQTSLVRALEPCTPTQLEWRPAPERRSVGEIARHISVGRINWFSRMGAPGVDKVVARVPGWTSDPDGVPHAVEGEIAADSASTLVDWLRWSWEPIGRVLYEWDASTLEATYEHRWRGDLFAVSRQWTVWRTMAHDIHHGGQIAILLACQGVEAFELQKLGGHIVDLKPITG